MLQVNNGRPAPVRVLQITDPHLMADPDGALLGVKTRDSLDAVIAHAQADPRAPDFILATGDLAQDASETAYQAFAARLGGFSCPSAWVAGNHDDSALLQSVAGQHNADHRQILLGGWQIVMLDSSVHKKVHGYLTGHELAFLDQCLAEHPDTPAMVSLHHHPVTVGSGWMEDIGLHNRDAFWQMIDRHAQVRVVLWGHIHQELDCYRGDVRLLATPSTCIQFTSGSREFAVEEKAPGYRWLDLHPDGRLETGVRRALDFTFDLDVNSTGY